MKNQEKYQKAFEFFKKSYAYKMGGTQTIQLPNKKEHHYDDRQYYQGRGEKYNSSIKHDNIGLVKVSRKEYSEFLKMLKNEKILKKQRIEAQNKKAQRLAEAKAKGVYYIDKNGYVELSDDESEKCTFDAKRLANTLKINIKDVELLNSGGKTYVFAKSEKGITYQLYHPSLECNDLSIHVEVATQERMDEFKPKEYQDAPYAHVVGQTENNNHFVC